MTAADCIAAWVHSLVRVSLDHIADAVVLRSLSLRRANLTLSDGSDQSRSVAVQLLLALPTTAKLVSLCISGEWNGVGIGACPALQHLRFLEISGMMHLNTADFRALAALPRLTALTLGGRDIIPAGFALLADSTFVGCKDSTDVPPNLC